MAKGSITGGSGGKTVLQSGGKSGGGFTPPQGPPGTPKIKKGIPPLPYDSQRGY